MGGFILGFDTDKEDIFDAWLSSLRRAVFLSRCGAAPGHAGNAALQAVAQRGPDCGRGRRQQHVLRSAQLFAPHGFGQAGGGLPRGDEENYNCEAYYERVKLYLNRAHPKPAKRAAESGEETATSELG